MKIVVSDITEEGLNLDMEVAVTSGPPLLLSPVMTKLRVEKAGSEVFVRGGVRAGVELQCSRCLRKFSKDIAADVNVVYHPIEELKGEEKHEIKQDELDMGFYEGDELDVEELVTEQIILAVPMKPLCSESCKGLCPRCGADLNMGSCACAGKEPDPRFAVLKNILDKGKE
jgi:uncharacterized protein